ncbi:MAG: ATP-binding protein [Parcubacteria group bacterium]|jgi:predicted AAA+ superfamily ATPase|nr:ATP-binding protein [Parcubacteria group bacterium]
MQKGLIKEVIAKQSQEKESLSRLKYVDRTKAVKGSELMSSPLIKVVLGPRRAGKSVFSLMLLKGKSFLYFNFDDPVLVGEKLDLYELVDELHKFYGETKFVLFDEIQNLKGWELFANRLHRQGYNLVLTGSNANLLSMELATHLTGRHLPIEILPFDFQEFLKAKNFSNLDQKPELLKLLEQYMTFGGFPEVVTKNQHPRGYLDVLFDSLLFKDVVKRHKVRFSEQIDQLGSYLINNVSNQYSFRKIANILKFKSDVTLERYLKYLEEAYIIFSLSGFSAKAGERLRSPKKIYTVDNGFVASKAVQHSSDNGKLMENLVFTEFVKRGFEPNRELFYYKTRNGREVDFAIMNGHEISKLIQVCYDVRSSDVEQREVKSLIEAGDELKVDNLTVLTWDDEREVEKNGKIVKFKPLWKWLLEIEK